jgi:hypothetical protein
MTQSMLHRGDFSLSWHHVNKTDQVGSHTLLRVGCDVIGVALRASGALRPLGLALATCRSENSHISGYIQVIPMP